MTPQHEDDVRRLLADARHTGPTPDDVVARLDRALAELAGDRPVATVTPLTQRRRNAGRLLLAAAAVVAVGVGVGQVLDSTSGSGADSGAGNESLTAGADSDGTRDTQDVPEAEAPGEAAGGGAGAASEAGPAPADSLVRGGLVRLRSDSFATEVTELSRTYLASTMSSEEADSTVGLLTDGLAAAAATCRADSWGRGRFVAVRYDRAPAVLVFRKASGDTQVADLFLCGSTSPERSVTLPAP